MAHLSRPLEASRPIGVDKPSVVAIIWRYPSFEPYQSWAIIRTRGGSSDQWRVRRTTWQRPIDFTRATDPLKQAAFMAESDPMPTVDVLDARMDGDLAGKLLERLGTLTVPSLLASESIGVDGVLNGLETQLGKVHIEWWCSGPPA